MGTGVIGRSRGAKSILFPRFGGWLAAAFATSRPTSLAGVQEAAYTQRARPEGSAMRYAVVGALFALLPLSAVAAPVTVPADAMVMPDTPSGKGDPNSIVCRAPQQFAGSNEMGPMRCGYNWEWWQLTTHGKDLAADGKTVIDRLLVANPKGDGNPDAVTCRKPKPIPGTRLKYGPEVCQTNQFWADLNKNSKIVDANGDVVSAWMSTTIVGPANASMGPPAYYVGSQ